MPPGKKRNTSHTELLWEGSIPFLEGSRVRVWLPVNIFPNGETDTNLQAAEEYIQRILSQFNETSDYTEYQYAKYLCNEFSANAVQVSFAAHVEHSSFSVVYYAEWP